MTKPTLPFPKAQTGPLPVVNALIIIEGKFPLLRRHKGADSWWDLPGGKPDSAGESYADTILRELDEELGIKACVISEKPVAITPHPFIKGTQKIFMLCAHLSGQAHNALPEEHDELRLVDAAEAVTLLGARITPDVAQALLDFEKSTQARKHPPKAPGAQGAML